MKINEDEQTMTKITVSMTKDTKYKCGGRVMAKDGHFKN